MNDRELYFKELIAERKSVEAGQCPKCSAGLNKTRDSRQAGPVRYQIVGEAWYRVSCQKCAYRADWRL